jgi:endonuclease YncB( thermonuclease family)
MCPHYSDAQTGGELRETTSDDYRVRAGTPLYFDTVDSCVPFNPSEHDRVDAIALMKQTHSGYSQHVESDIQDDVVFTVEDGERSIKPLEGGYNSDGVSVFSTEADFPSVPTARISDGDTIELRSVTADCESYNGDGPPIFRSRKTPVSLVEDIRSVDGVRLAPTDAVDGRKSSYQLGTVAQLGGAFRSKSQTKGYNETISVTVKQQG